MDLPSKSWDPGKGDWTPNCSYSVSSAGVLVLVELAGLKSGDVEIIFEGNRIQLTGSRLRNESRSPDEELSGEVKFGRFHVIREFPAGYNTAQSKAAYSNGFLRIDVPVAEGTGRVAF